MTNIYVGNLSYQTTDQDLTELFSSFGGVQSAAVIKDKHSGRSKGFGFVEIADAAAAKKAIEELNEKEVQGRKLIVNEARPREDKPRRDSRDGGSRW